MTDDDALGPAPYELRLMEHPQDRSQFNDWVAAISAISRPGSWYRVPFWACRARRREARRNWEQMIRIRAGRIYELGRGQS